MSTWLGHEVPRHFSSVQSLSRVRLFVTPWTTAHQASLSITNSWSLPKLMSIESVLPSNHLILGCPLLLLPSIFPNIRVFSNESALASGDQSIGMSASTSVLPVNTQDWFPLAWTGWISLPSKGLSSFLQHHSSKASVLLRSAFFTVQLSHPYMTTRKVPRRLVKCYSGCICFWLRRTSESVDWIKHMAFPNVGEPQSINQRPEQNRDWMRGNLSCGREELDKLTSWAHSACLTVELGHLSSSALGLELILSALLSIQLANFRSWDFRSSTIMWGN